MTCQGGATKLEFAVIVAIFGILATALVLRLNAIQAETERTEVDLTVRNIQVGIQLAYLPRLPGAFDGATELRWQYVARADASGKKLGASLVGLN